MCQERPKHDQLCPAAWGHTCNCDARFPQVAEPVFPRTLAELDELIRIIEKSQPDNVIIVPKECVPALKALMEGRYKR